MTSKRDRKAALRQWKTTNRSKDCGKLPLAQDRMRALFDMLDAELPERGCDDTLRLVREWCAQQGLAFDTVQTW